MVASIMSPPQLDELVSVALLANHPTCGWRKPTWNVAWRCSSRHGPHAKPTAEGQFSTRATQQLSSQSLPPFRQPYPPRGLYDNGSVGKANELDVFRAAEARHRGGGGLTMKAVRAAYDLTRINRGLQKTAARAYADACNAGEELQVTPALLAAAGAKHRHHATFGRGGPHVESGISRAHRHRLLRSGRISRHSKPNA